MDYRVSIDVGGTFTDAISVDKKGNMVMVKTLSTPDDLKVGVTKCIDELAHKANVDRKAFLDNVTTIVHGTTQGFSTVFNRSGPKLGIIGTEGHTDTIQLRRVIKENMWDWRMPFPRPLVPRYLQTEVEERATSKGEVLKPLKEQSVHKAVTYLKKMKVNNIVVGLLFSFLYPEHERRVQEIIKQDYPEAEVTLSHEVLPAAGEYERFSTTIIDAYIRPALAAYVQSLKDFLVKNGFKGQLLFIQNNGGTETADAVMQRPSTLVVPGPAAGPAAALAIGGAKDEKNLLSADMGGIDFNIAVISNRTITFKEESLICDHRFSLPVVDIETLGPGGGSIAWFDIGETLHVGPKSAGAYPGPACYGNGGKDATFIDAALILGYITPDYLFKGEKRLSKDLAEKVVKEKVADRLGISIIKAANTIFKTFNLVMANGISHAIIKRGYDPRNFVFCAGGGAGPLCALEIAKELGMRKILIPKIAPVYCAFGMLNVDLRHDFSRYYYVSQNDLNLEYVKKLYKEMEAEGSLLMEKENVPENQRVLLRTMRLRYYGQFRDLEVSWPSGAITKRAIAEGIANFHHKHESLYGFTFENYPVEFVRFGLTTIGKMPKITLRKIKRGTEDASSALKGERRACFEEINGFVKTKVYNGDELCSGNVLDGPCIVEEKMTSIVIPPNFKMRVDEYGNYTTVK